MSVRAPRSHPAVRRGSCRWHSRRRLKEADLAAVQSATDATGSFNGPSLCPIAAGIAFDLIPLFALELESRMRQ